MKIELVAAFSQAIQGNAPEWIMYAPAGRHTISAKVNGKPANVTLTVDEAAAKALQSDLMARRAAGGPQPFFDFHHDARDRSAFPEEFAWRTFIVDGEEREGIGARVRWTMAGLEATKSDPENGIAANVPYFSPRCAISKGRIVGLMDASTGNSAGGLVSDPAFDKIAPAALAASLTPTPKIMDKKRLMKMAGYADDMEDVDETELMSKLEAMCSGYGKKKDMSASKVADLEAAKATAESERDAIKAELEAAQTELEAARTQAADAFVASLEASGKIPPRAEKQKAFLRKAYLTNPDEAKEFASELTASNPGSERITDDSNAKNHGESPADKGALRSNKANELLAAKAAPTFEAAWEAACALIP
jgi:outer membrane murein-binding lipoprotein Lpp